MVASVERAVRVGTAGSSQMVESATSGELSLLAMMYTLEVRVWRHMR